MPATQKALFKERNTGHGTYWVSEAPRSAIKAAMADMRPAAWKTASIGGEQEQGFEQAFSSLAYAYLKDKSPRLIDFIVGFQLIDRNEDNTKAVGIFGFKVGDQWLYAPVFFLNGDLKGHELLYIKKQDAFVPMKENWVNYLISRKPHVLGEGSPQNTFQLGGIMPQLTRLARPPMAGTKYGSDQSDPVQFAAWSHDALPPIFALATKKASAIYPGRPGTLNFGAVVDRPLTAALAPFSEAFDLRNVLYSLPGLKTACERAYMQYPLVKKGFDTFYGPDFFQSVAATARRRDDLVKRASPPAPRPKPLPPSDPRGTSLFRPAPAFDPNEGLYVYAADMKVDEEAPGGVSENKPELTDEEREKLLRDTVLIKDERKANSIAYNTQVRMDLVNPFETGIYEILEKPGKFSEMVIIHNPQSGRGRENFSVVLRKDSPKNWKNCHGSNLWAKQCHCPTPEDWKKYVDGLSGVTDLQKGGTYVALHHNGSGTCPFTIREDFGDGAYSVEWHDHCAYTDRGKTYQDDAMCSSRDWEVGYDSWNARVYINWRKGSGLRSVNGELSIPDSYKVVKISDPPKPKKTDDIVSMCCSSPPDEAGASEKEPILPGNIVDVQLMLDKRAAALTIHDAGSEVVLKGYGGTKQMGKKAALISLVRDHGLREEQARLMLKEAAAQRPHNRAVKYVIKYAYGYGGDLQPGPGAPTFPEQIYGTEQNGPNSVTSTYPQEDYLPVDEMSSQLTDPSVYDPFYQPDQGAMQVAQQAAQGGQKEVFDTAMISGMLKSVRKDSLVDRHLGDLMKALDKLGRILFMFYWHQEEFEDRYGKQDLPELEDSLRNAFEVLGDVVLFLKEKTVQGGSGVMQSSGVGASDQGEPSVQEAARN